MIGRELVESSDTGSRFRWTAFVCASAVFFFLNLATFQTLGVVLFKMVADLNWSQTAAGSSFTFLGLACGVMSPLPALAIKSLGSRFTLCIGAVLLAAGFWLCAQGDTLITFYVAMTLIGSGFAFSGSVPGVYLIAGWFQRRSSRVIGFYFMFGALGAALGPPIVDWVVRKLGWRGHWELMAIVAIALGVLCLGLVRDPRAAKEGAAQREPEKAAVRDTGEPEWTPRRALSTSQFLLIAGAMTGTMACVLTLASIIIGHLVRLGATATDAAFVFGALGLTSTFVKAGAGWACEKIRPELLASGGLLLQMAATFIFATAGDPLSQYAAAGLFGTGWGLAYVTGPVLLIAYFGQQVGPRVLSGVWLLSSLAAAGPLIAGLVVDQTGSFSPMFYGLGVVMLVLAVPVGLMRSPNSAAPAEGVATPDLA